MWIWITPSISTPSHIHKLHIHKEKIHYPPNPQTPITTKTKINLIHIPITNRYHSQDITPQTTNHQHKVVPMLKYLQICVLTVLLLSGCQSTKTTAETSVKTIFDPCKQEVCGPIHLEWKVKKEW